MHSQNAGDSMRTLPFIFLFLGFGGPALADSSPLPAWAQPCQAQEESLKSTCKKRESRSSAMGLRIVNFKNCPGAAMVVVSYAKEFCRIREMKNESLKTTVFHDSGVKTVSQDFVEGAREWALFTADGALTCRQEKDQERFDMCGRTDNKRPSVLGIPSVRVAFPSADSIDQLKNGQLTLEDVFPLGTSVSLGAQGDNPSVLRQEKVGQSRNQGRLAPDTATE